MVSGYGVRPTPIEILNISARGAMIRGIVPTVRKDDEVILKIRNMVVVATIAWARDGMAGLAFRCPVDPILIARMNGQIRAAAQPPVAARDDMAIDAP